jgi:hypothetical protein
MTAPYCPASSRPVVGGLRAARVELSDANAFVLEHHRHHDPETGHRFSLGVSDDSGLRGVAICGRPKAGHTIDQRGVLEVVRVATDGARNACSWLYAAAARVAVILGFRAVITYTLADGETGASLRACGWWPEVLPENSGDWKFDTRGGQMRLIELPTKRGQDLGAKVRWLWLTGCDQ